MIVYICPKCGSIYKDNSGPRMCTCNTITVNTGYYDISWSKKAIHHYKHQMRAGSFEPVFFFTGVRIPALRSE